MPRTLPAALTTVMDAGSFDPYLRVHLNASPSDVGSTVLQPKSFKIEDLKAEIEVENTPGAIDEGYFRIERGALIAGVPVTVSTIWYSIISFTFDQKFYRYFGHALDKTYVTVAADSDYETVIEEALTNIGSDAHTIIPNYEGSAAWKAYQFYPDGKTIVLSPRTKLASILQQKYMLFAADDGWDGANSNLFFFVATQTRATDYTVVDPLLTIAIHTETRRLIWRDEAATVHSVGPSTATIHNLGYLESTASDPSDPATPQNTFLGSHSSRLPVHLKYRTGDQVRIENHDASWQITGRVRVKEVLDLKSYPSWYQVLERLEFFSTTEGGPLPSTIEAAAPYTPLATGTFDAVLSEEDNNLQAAMESIDDHHPGGAVREVLTAARTYYVRTDGDDDNTGLVDSAAGAFLTIQKAIDVVAALDISIYDVTIQIGAGTYSSAVAITCKQCVGAGAITIIGDETTPANVLVQVTTASTAVFSSSGISTSYVIRGMQLKSTAGSGFAIISDNNSIVYFQKIDINSGFQQQLRASDGGYLEAIGNYTISSGATNHMTGVRGHFRVASKTITITGTPAFTNFISLGAQSFALLNSNTWSGSATGSRYFISDNSVVFTVAVGGTSGWTEADLPGNALGTTRNGGRYNNFLNTYRVATQFDKANTTLADITELVATMLLAGRTYRFRAVLYTTSNVASGVKAAIAGTCTATAIIYEGEVHQTGVLVAPGTSRATALATAVANVTAVTVATIIIEGTITVNAAGTLAVQFADNAGTNTSSVLVGSTLEIQDVTP